MDVARLRSNKPLTNSFANWATKCEWIFNRTRPL